MPTSPHGGSFCDTTTLFNPTGWALGTTLVVPRCRFALGFYPSARAYPYTSILAPQDLSQILWDFIVEARDALSPFLGECCTNDMFCIDFLNDHSIVPTNNLPHNCRDAALVHLLNGKCMSTLHVASCKIIARDSLSATHLSHVLHTLLLDAYQKK